MENRPFGQTPPPLDYQAATLGRPVFSVRAFVGVLIFSGVVTISMVLEPKFETIFRDFHTDILTVTIWFLELGRFFWNDFGWLLLVALVVVFPFVWAAMSPPPEDGPQTRLRRGWLTIIVTWLTFIWVIFVVIALLAPMLSLTGSVSTPSK